MYLFGLCNFFVQLLSKLGKSSTLYLHIFEVMTFIVTAVRHYEVVFLIHEQNAEEVESVNEKVQGNVTILALWLS